MASLLCRHLRLGVYEKEVMAGEESLVISPSYLDRGPEVVHWCDMTIRGGSVLGEYAVFLGSDA
jgi:hypothetical protein